MPRPLIIAAVAAGLLVLMYGLTFTIAADPPGGAPEREAATTIPAPPGVAPQSDFDLPPNGQVRPIHVQELMFRPVIGILGKTLGIKIVVQGKFHMAMMANPMAVTKIDGQAPARELLISVRGVDLKDGVDYTLEGYETGGWEGPPMWHAPKIQQPFQYRPYFVVTNVISPAPAPAEKVR